MTVPISQKWLSSQKNEKLIRKYENSGMECAYIKHYPPWCPSLYAVFVRFHSTVTDFAKLRGRSTFCPLNSAKWYDNNCIGMTVKITSMQSTVCGTRKTCSSPQRSSSGTRSSQMIIGRPVWPRLVAMRSSISYKLDPCTKS